MASVRELKSRWQIRFYDAKREPKRTTNSVRKSNFPTRSKAEWRQQLYDRGEYNPWVQNHPSDTAGQDTVTVGEAVEQYIEDKTRAGERSERRGWSEQSVRNKGSILRDFARRVGRGRLVEHLTPEDPRGFIYRKTSATPRCGRTTPCLAPERRGWRAEACRSWRCPARWRPRDASPAGAHESS